MHKKCAMCGHKNTANSTKCSHCDEHLNNTQIKKLVFQSDDTEVSIGRIIDRDNCYLEIHSATDHRIIYMDLEDLNKLIHSLKEMAKTF